MKTLYFDCFAGASGDMILGALIDAGVAPEAFTKQLTLLGITGYSIDFETVDRSGISATYARVQTPHEHSHRHLSDILKIIYESRLSDNVKDRAAKIFSRLAGHSFRVGTTELSLLIAGALLQDVKRGVAVLMGL